MQTGVRHDRQEDGVQLAGTHGSLPWGVGNNFNVDRLVVRSLRRQQMHDESGTLAGIMQDHWRALLRKGAIDDGLYISFACSGGVG